MTPDLDSDAVRTINQVCAADLRAPEYLCDTWRVVCECRSSDVEISCHERDLYRVRLSSGRWSFEVTGERRYPLRSTMEAEKTGEHADLWLQSGERDNLVQAAVDGHASWLRGRSMRATFGALEAVFAMRSTLPKKANRRNYSGCVVR
jgi:hypothetical protein